MLFFKNNISVLSQYKDAIICLQRQCRLNFGRFSVIPGTLSFVTEQNTSCLDITH